ncbi:hypothetical protein [Leucobacter ruminantium]|uniref:DUF2892 domain-containing protein n=1 Tax=Leucobacter ruminantium TaxID=1289170 RepID=A0A939LTG8_9MICO|nr:hypothetical protein [Leucobacter ruminantium]MBO1804509.1 hypothetical protein [Leucobacter ruminantium]
MRVAQGIMATLLAGSAISSGINHDLALTVMLAAGALLLGALSATGRCPQQLGAPRSRHRADTASMPVPDARSLVELSPATNLKESWHE